MSLSLWSTPTAFSDIRLSPSQARVAADTTGRLDRLFKFAEIGVFDVLLSTRDTATLEVLADRLAARTPSIGITSRDRPCRNALTAYLRHNGQVESASSALGVHRHTMRNRLVKIRELVQCDLNSIDTRAELWLAVNARELLGMQLVNEWHPSKHVVDGAGLIEPARRDG